MITGLVIGLTIGFILGSLFPQPEFIKENCARVTTFFKEKFGK